MDIHKLKATYENLLRPVFGELLRIDDSDEDKNWVVVILDGVQEDFYFSLYGIDCVHLYWCNECFIFNKQRNGLVSSDTYGEIVFEGNLDMESTQISCRSNHAIKRLYLYNEKGNCQRKNAIRL